MNEKDIRRVVEQFCRKEVPDEGQVKITRVPNYKTVYVEQIGEIGRAIVFNEYIVDGMSYWAGYSARSETIYISHANQG